MKDLTIGALLLALSCAPSIAKAATTGGSKAGVSGSSGRSLEPAAVTVLPDEARDYAAREAATPTLGRFQGGGVGVYVGGGAVTAVLLVVLIVILL